MLPAENANCSPAMMRSNVARSVPELSGFYDENDKITIDDNIKTYMETAKTLYDEDLTFNTDQWSADWSANMSGDGVDSNAALAYMGCPWFVYWSLSDA
ncbi:MAG: hypothetical protein ACLU9T_11140 [Blautia faecis]